MQLKRAFSYGLSYRHDTVVHIKCTMCVLHIPKCIRNHFTMQSYCWNTTWSQTMGIKHKKLFSEKSTKNRKFLCSFKKKSIFSVKNASKRINISLWQNAAFLMNWSWSHRKITEHALFFSVLTVSLLWNYWSVEKLHSLSFSFC